MHLSIFKIVLFGAISALVAVAAIFRDTIRTGKDPSDDGPRALISEFLGFWIGGFFLIWSFTVDGKHLQWTLRGIAAIAAIVGIGLSVFFADKTEVPETPDKEPTGFKSDITSIHLE
jgi:hypothetical protein